MTPGGCLVCPTKFNKLTAGVGLLLTSSLQLFMAPAPGSCSQTVTNKVGERAYERAVILGLTQGQNTLDPLEIIVLLVLRT